LGVITDLCIFNRLIVTVRSVPQHTFPFTYVRFLLDVKCNGRNM
jgi:hypothetical protein